MKKRRRFAGFTANLNQKYFRFGAHPGYNIISMRPSDWKPRMGGLDTLSHGLDKRFEFIHQPLELTGE